MLFGHLYVFFGEMSIQTFFPFFDFFVLFCFLVLGGFFDIELHELFVYFGD